MDQQNTAEGYEAPAITDIASVHELTLGRKKVKRAHHASDGMRMANKIKTS